MVTTTTQLSDFARVVGGDRVEVHDVIKANVDAHDYEPTPADIEAVRGADLVLRNGAGLDDWLEPTLETAEAEAPVVDATEGIELRRGDPHVWFDVTRARTMVANVSRALARVNPENTSTYSANEAAYAAQLEALDAEIRAAIGSLSNKKLVTNHDAFGYYVERYGLDFVGSVIPSFDSQAELSSRDLSELVDRVKAEGARAVFSEASLPPKAAETIAREAGVKVVAGDDALYGDSLGPAGSDGDSYLKMMRHNTRVIVENLR
ncbi:MAG: metal ABC transporter substrate-binding protein [Actinomycetota bacterium]|nr:metal ABC transporter substrate-binding protein [Actinomycetota bacterium]